MRYASYLAAYRDLSTVVYGFKMDPRQKLIPVDFLPQLLMLIYSLL